MDPNSKQLLHIYAELEAELHENILPFWMNRVSDPQTGGYHGKILSNGTVVSDAARGAVLNARILWTFSAAYNATGRDEYLKEAQKSCQYFVNHFLDRQKIGRASCRVRL